MNPTVLETKTLKYSINEFWDNGIIYIKINDHAEISLEDSKAQLDFLRERYDGLNKFIILVEPGRYSSVTKEAREFSALPSSNEMTIATAVIIKSLAQRLVINFLISVTRQQAMKMRMFDDRKKAVEWLLSFKT